METEKHQRELEQRIRDLEEKRQYFERLEEEN
jgi:hypothetical protein